MKSKTLYAMLIVGLSLPIVGCSGTSGPLFTENRPYDRIALPASRVDVRIVDDRIDVASASFEVPAVTLPGQGSSASVPIPTHFDVLIARRLAPLVQDSGPELVFEIEVVQAEIGWKANWMSEEEFARVDLVIRILRRDSGTILVEGTGSSWGKIWDADTNPDAPHELLNRVFVDAFDDFLCGDHILEELARRLDSASHDLPR